MIGAAFNPRTNTWRRIASLPSGAAGYGSTIQVGGEVVFLSYVIEGRDHRGGLWSYSLTTDAWRAVTLPESMPSSLSMTEHRGRVVIYSGSHERGRTPDFIFDQVTGTWDELPADPFDASYDRRLLSVDGSLVLFAKLISEARDSRLPSVVHAALLGGGREKVGAVAGFGAARSTGFR